LEEVTVEVGEMSEEEDGVRDVDEGEDESIDCAHE